MDGFVKSQPNASAVISVGKSRWKITGYFLLLLLSLVIACCFLISFWGSVVWQTFFTAFFAYPAFSIGLQLVLVIKCAPPLLVLEAEGLRVNFTKDFIRYDQIARVSLSTYHWAMRLQLVSGVSLKSGRAPFGLLGSLFGKLLVFNDFYSIPVDELAGEIERRKKALDDGKRLKENDAGAGATS